MQNIGYTSAIWNNFHCARFALYLRIVPPKTQGIMIKYVIRAKKNRSQRKWNTIRRWHRPRRCRSHKLSSAWRNAPPCRVPTWKRAWRTAIWGHWRPTERKHGALRRPRLVPPEHQSLRLRNIRGYETSAEAKKAGANAIKDVNVQFTKSVAMREALSTSNVEFGLQADVTNDWRL